MLANPTEFSPTGVWSHFSKANKECIVMSLFFMATTDNY